MILFLLLFNGFVLWLVLEMVAGFFVPAKMTSVSHGAKAAAVHAQNAAQQIASAPLAIHL